ncbi:MAG: prolipoprotein diacylglyceryl transferase [Lachnospiraceae bacterium]|nr:prolipoprotein diacylglyceryl transferase [Lachnospiraceae bacterium]
MHNDLLKIGKFTLHGYSVMIALGFIVAMSLCLLKAKKEKKDGDVITDIGLIAVVGGFLGAKILYFIVCFKDLLAHPKYYLSFPGVFSGFVVYGGIIFGTAAVIVYAKIKKINAFEYLDFMVPFIAMVQGFGRIGCFLAGCCYGAPTDSFLGVTFPEGSLAPAGIKLWPTQLFSAVGDFAICGLLLLFAKKNKKTGNVCVLYAILYAIGRFAVEFFRNDARGTVGTLSTSQFISLLLLPIAIGIGVLINLPKEKKEEKNEDKKEEA